MSWIPSYLSLRTHRKTARLARILQTSLPAAIGHLHCLWWWSVDNSKDGRLNGVDAQDLADAALWEGDPEALVDGLVRAGFLDRDDQGLALHKWPDYAGRLLDIRAKNAERQRSYRERHRNVPVTLPLNNAQEERRGEERTGKDILTTLQARYEQAFGLALTPTRAQRLADLAEDFGTQATLDALDEAAKRNKADPRYMEAILQRWRAEGRPGKGTKHEKAGRHTDPDDLDAWAVRNWELLGYASEDAARRAIAGGQEGGA